MNWPPTQAPPNVPGVGQLITRLSVASAATEEEKLEVWFDPDQIQVFHPSDGRNLTLPPGVPE